MIIRIGVPLLALIGIVSALMLMRQIQTPPPKAELIVAPAKNPYATAVAASGIVEAVQDNIAIGVPTPGLVLDVFVEVWDAVEANQPLFQIDDRELKAQLGVRRANVAVATANVQRIEAQLKRLKSVADLRAVSRDEVETRENDLAVVHAQLALQQAELKQTELLIDRLIVKAPKAGVILQSEIRKGEYAAVNPDEPAMILGELDALQVRVDVDEQIAYRVRKGSLAVAYPKNNTSLAIPLEMIRIEPLIVPKRSLTGDSNERVDTRVLQVIYRFKQPKDYPIYVGQQLDVFIED